MKTREAKPLETGAGEMKARELWPTMLARPLVATLLAAGLLAACSAAPPPGGPGATADRSSFEIPFERESLGAGPQPVVGVLQIGEGEMAQLVSRAILDAFQRLRHSIVDPELSLDDLLPPRERWRTDRVPLSRDDVEAYNAAVPGTPLPLDRLLAVEYVGRYLVRDKELRFELSTLLYQRGAAGDHHPYPGDYDGRYFLAQAEDGIRERLMALAAEDPS